MQSVNFGRIENMAVRNGEPLFDPAPRVLRTIRFAAANGNRPELHTGDFAVKREVLDLFGHLDALSDGVVQFIEVRHGLPLFMEIEAVIVA